MTERTLGTFRIDKAQWEAFQVKAKEHGSNASSLIIGWIETYLDGSIDSIDNNQISLDNSIDNSIDNIDERIDKRIDTVFLSVQERLDRLEQELEKFAA
jgi:hypothetical protein